MVPEGGLVEEVHHLIAILAQQVVMVPAAGQLRVGSFGVPGDEWGRVHAPRCSHVSVSESEVVELHIHLRLQIFPAAVMDGGSGHFIVGIHESSGVVLRKGDGAI